MEQYCAKFCMGVKYGLTLEEEHKLQVFAKEVHRKIVGPKRCKRAF